MTCVFSRLFAAVALTLSCAANAQTPPTKVEQPDGTIQLVPVPPAYVLTPYYIDPTMTFRVLLECSWSNKDWNGASLAGLTAMKGSTVKVNILIQPIPKTKTVDGKTYSMYSVFRSADFVITWDPSIFEQLAPQLPGDIFEPGKCGIVSPELSNGLNESAVPQDGNMLYHVQTYSVPEKRNPPLKPMYYQWNWDGFLWQGGFRNAGTLLFRVKDDFYYPTTKLASIKILPSTVVNAVETKTRVDGGVVVGSNTQLGETRNSTNDIRFGSPPDYKVSHALSAPTVQYKVGDIVPVKVLIKNETKPQSVSSVYTIFGWDRTKLEFMGIDKTGARPSTSSYIGSIGATSVNEATIPKDGNAAHTWLSVLGDKTFIDKENIVVTLKFKVVSQFTTATVSILQNNDPSLAGLFVGDTCGILGSSLPGSFVTGARSGAVINGVLP